MDFLKIYILICLALISHGQAIQRRFLEMRSLSYPSSIEFKENKVLPEILPEFGVLNVESEFNHDKTGVIYIPSLGPLYHNTNDMIEAKKRFSFKDFANKAINKVKNVGSDVVNSGKNVVNTVGSAVVNTGKNVVNKVGAVAVNTGKTVGAGVVNTGKTVGAGVVNTGKIVGAGVVNTGKTIGEGVVNTGKTVGEVAVITGKTVGEVAVITGKAVGEVAVIAGKNVAEFVTDEKTIKALEIIGVGAGCGFMGAAGGLISPAVGLAGAIAAGAGCAVLTSLIA